MLLPITMTEIRSKGWTKYGKAHEGTVLENTVVEIELGKSITLMTVVPGGSRYVRDENIIDIQTGKAKFVPCEEHLVTKTFEIGDTAKVGSYNLTYFGTVKKITAKTVTLVEYDGHPGLEKTYRFDIHTFATKNRYFDADEASERNAEIAVTL